MNNHTMFHASHKPTLFTTLLIITLISSLFISAFVNNSMGTSLTDVVHVKNESELKNAINTASKETTMALDKDITLTDTLKIPVGKDITLTSNKATGFYKLIGASDKHTITVEGGGLLKLDGIIVTHKNSDEGRGVEVLENGLLIMYKGEISGNTNTGNAIPNTLGGQTSEGGGVYIEYGVFEMHDGKISNNKANAGRGGGVHNLGGTFKNLYSVKIKR